MFDGKYHGHADELLAVESGTVAPEGSGMLRDSTRHVRIVPYNDLDAVEEVRTRRHRVCGRRGGDHKHGRHPVRRGIPRRPAQAHRGCRNAAGDRRDPHVGRRPGRADRRWGLQPDLLVVGKSISGGIPSAPTE